MPVVCGRALLVVEAGKVSGAKERTTLALRCLAALLQPCRSRLWAAVACAPTTLLVMALLLTLAVLLADAAPPLRGRAGSGAPALPSCQPEELGATAQALPFLAGFWFAPERHTHPAVAPHA